MTRFSWVLGLLLFMGTLRAEPPAKSKYEAPNAKGPVVELLDEGVDLFLKELTNDTSGPSGQVIREDADVFSGIESVRIKPQQRFRTQMPGWEFKIVEKPSKPGEFRYLRFAWKKQNGGMILLAFAINGGQWIGRRYVAGPYDLGGSGFKVADVAPTEWTIVTRDVFKDYGAITLNGILFSVDNVGVGYIDHILLGRTVEDLDLATSTALGRSKLVKALNDTQREELWKEMTGRDNNKASVAFRTLLSDSPEIIGFIREKITPPKDDSFKARLQALILELDDVRYINRERATKEIKKLGPRSIPVLKAAIAAGASSEVRVRAEEIIRAIGPKPGELTAEQVLAARVARILERDNTAPARELLAKLAAGDYGLEFSEEAKAAIERMPKKVIVPGIK